MLFECFFPVDTVCSLLFLLYCMYVEVKYSYSIKQYQAIHCTFFIQTEITTMTLPLINLIPQDCGSSGWFSPLPAAFKCQFLDDLLVSLLHNSYRPCQSPVRNQTQTCINERQRATLDADKYWSVLH